MPRPQQNLWSFDIMLGCLLILTITFFLLTLYNILQANTALLPIEAIRFLSLKLIDTSTTASLFVTLMGALLVRHQFALGLHPRINYKSANAIKVDAGDPSISFQTWRVEMRNSGLGAAIINTTSYILELADAKSDCREASFQGIIKELAKMDLIRGSDYWLENIAAGFALSPKDDCFVFEIKTEHLVKIKRLDMVLHFQNQLGGKYLREIFCIPHGIHQIKN